MIHQPFNLPTRALNSNDMAAALSQLVNLRRLGMQLEAQKEEDQRDQGEQLAEECRRMAKDPLFAFIVPDLQPCTALVVLPVAPVVDEELRDFLVSVTTMTSEEVTAILVAR